MKTAEEILSEYESFHYSTTELYETHYYKHNVLEAMKEYARQALDEQKQKYANEYDFYLFPLSIKDAEIIELK